jgi:hypothetical protein
MNLMLDFETLGTTPDTVVLSLGAVLFNNDGSYVKSEYFKLNVQDQIDKGRKVNIDTVNWWYNQSRESRKVLQPDKWDLSIERFKIEFNAFLIKNKVKNESLIVWGNGATFDVSIIENIFSYNVPWKFWNVRCYRTFDHCFKIKDLVKREGIYHHALDDALHQANCVIAYYKQTQPTQV